MEESILRKSVGTYITKNPTPTREENDKLLKQLATMSHLPNTEKPKLYYIIRDKLVLSNGGFAMKYVMKYKSVLNDDVSIMDLFQEANIGLMEAIDKFDLNLKIAFTTYAFYHVKKRIIDFIKKNKLVRAPRDIARNMRHVNEVKNELFVENKREPLASEIAEALHKRRGIILNESMIDSITILLDLNSSGTDNSFISEFNEQISTETKHSDIFQRMEINLLKDLKKESDKFQNIVKLRFGIGQEYPHTLEEIKYMLKLDEKDIK